jgi:hypothetical protein
MPATTTMESTAVESAATMPAATARRCGCRRDQRDCGKGQQTKHQFA